MTYTVGIVGCGAIGTKRANSLPDNAKLIAVSDINENKAKIISDKFNADYYSKWEELIENNDIQIVIICTPHICLANILKYALEKNKHVFVEKPAAINSNEISLIPEILARKNLKLRVGYNHRYHRSVLKALRIFQDGGIGDLMFLRARYGHGGRLGYDQEWRLNPKLSGGGELIDQGSHLIDLAKIFMGKIEVEYGIAANYFWKIDVDDNAFFVMRNVNGNRAMMHVSSTEWRNLFSMEIYGDKGKIELSGLGGSYGVEKVTFYKMLPEMGPPEIFTWEYPMEDNSWKVELNELLLDIQLNRIPSPGINDAIETLKIVEEIYKRSNYDFSS
jgi:predicted dehydrogenase